MCPIYLHPAPPPRIVNEAYYSGLPEAAAACLSTSGWGWHSECAMHVLRMVVAGVFEELPDLKVIVGHMGEGLPFHLDRIESMLSPVVTGQSLSVAETLRRNLYLTTSGYNFDAPLLCALAAFGVDRVMFSVDHPFGSSAQATAFLRSAPVADGDREKIAHGNARSAAAHLSVADRGPRSTMTLFAGAGTPRVTSHFINGEWTEPSGPTFPVLNPLNDERVADVAAGGAAEMRAAVEAAAAAFPAWANLNPGARQHLFLAAADIVDRRQEELVELMAVEGGASRAFSSFQIRLSSAMLRQAAGWGYLPAGDVLRSDIPGRMAMVVRKPLGVVAGFTPWNGAFYLAWRTFLLPMAFGNTTVIKPSELAPMSAGLIHAEILAEAGFPAGSFNVVTNAPGDAAAVSEVFFDAPGGALHQLHRIGQDRPHPRREGRPGAQAHGARAGRIQPGARPGGRRHRRIDQGGHLRRIPAPGAGVHELAEGLRPPIHPRRVRRRVWRSESAASRWETRPTPRSSSAP